MSTEKQPKINAPVTTPSLSIQSSDQMPLSESMDMHQLQRLASTQRPHHETMSPKAVMQLQRSLGNRATQRLFTRTGNNPALQRASAYDGVMPAHDTYGDSYTFEGKKSEKFTYHHIIPENKLDLVTGALERIKKYFETLEETKDNQALRDEGGKLNSETDTLITGAKAGWMNARVQNLTFFINKEFKGDGINVSETEVRIILEGTDPDLTALFTKFKVFIKQKVKSKNESAARKLTDELKNDRLGSLMSELRGRDRSKIKTKLESLFQGLYFDFDVMADQAMEYLNSIPKSRRGEPLNKGAVRGAIMGSMDTAFETYYTRVYTFITKDSTAGDTLKALLQKYAMPHGEGKHLEHAIQWNPGNIHRGPESSYRLNPKDKTNFEQYLDDGGDEFEIAAQNLINKRHYGALEALNEKIDNFISIEWVADKDSQDAPDIATVQAATVIIQDMQKIQKFGTTKFDKSQWEEVDIDGKKKMRLIPTEGVKEKMVSDGEQDNVVEQQGVLV